MFKIFLLIILISVGLFTFPIAKEYITAPKNIKKIEWKQIFDLTTLHKDYIAQAIAYHNEYIFFTVHEKDKRSLLLVFTEKDDKLHLYKQFVLPSEATHASDLSFYDGYLYAIDYASTSVYKIDILKSMDDDQLMVNTTVKINKSRTGSLEIIEYKEKRYLLVTSFLFDNKMYVYDFESFMKKENTQPLFTIDNSYFVQGLYFDKKENVLYQSVNKKGHDAIYKIDPAKLFETRKFSSSILETYDTPVDMVEDLFVRDGIIYTSQEKTNKIYRGEIK